MIHALLLSWLRKHFSDLRTVATERTPVLLRGGPVERAFDRAEVAGRFSVDAVSSRPRRSANSSCRYC
jgi:hypothetical protein